MMSGARLFSFILFLAITNWHSSFHHFSSSHRAPNNDCLYCIVIETRHKVPPRARNNHLYLHHHHYNATIATNIHQILEENRKNPIKLCILWRKGKKRLMYSIIYQLPFRCCAYQHPSKTRRQSTNQTWMKRKVPTSSSRSCSQIEIDNYYFSLHNI